MWDCKARAQVAAIKGAGALKFICLMRSSGCLACGSEFSGLHLGARALFGFYCLWLYGCLALDLRLVPPLPGVFLQARSP